MFVFRVQQLRITPTCRDQRFPQDSGVRVIQGPQPPPGLGLAKSQEPITILHLSQSVLIEVWRSLDFHTRSAAAAADCASRGCSVASRFGHAGQPHCKRHYCRCQCSSSLQWHPPHIQGQHAQDNPEAASDSASSALWCSHMAFILCSTAQLSMKSSVCQLTHQPNAAADQADGSLTAPQRPATCLWTAYKRQSLPTAGLLQAGDSPLGVQDLCRAGRGALPCLGALPGQSQRQEGALQPLPAHPNHPLDQRAGMVGRQHTGLAARHRAFCST